MEEEKIYGASVDRQERTHYCGTFIILSQAQSLAAFRQQRTGGMKQRDWRKPKTNRSLGPGLVRFLSSMRVGIFLLLILAIMAVYGSLLPHDVAIDEVYGSWWFVTTLVALSVNLSFCSLRRLKRIWQRATRPPQEISGDRLKSCENRVTLSVSGNDQQIAGRVRDLFSSQGYRAGITPCQGGLLVSSEKGRVGYFGSFITHVSLVLILLAGFYGIVNGYEHFEAAFPGRFIRVPNEDFSVRVDDFYIAYRDDAQKSVEQYYSKLTVIQRGHAVKEDTVYVNKPLRYDGVTFYQSSYGWAVNAQFSTVTGESERALLVPGGVYHHHGTGTHVQLVEFFPSFALTEDGRAVNQGEYPANPYVGYRVMSVDDDGFDTVKYAPLNQVVQVSGGHQLEFVSYRNYTGFLIVKNPGKWLAFAGAVLLIIGLVLSFYVFPRRMWAYVKGKEILLAGESYRNQVGFKLEFERLANEIEKRMTP